MPITFPGLPPAPAPMGIGMTVAVRSDYDLVVQDFYFRVTLAEVETGRVVGSARSGPIHGAVDQELEIGRLINNSGQHFWQAYPQFPASAHGKQVIMRAEFYNASDVLVDSGQIAVTHDTQTGLQWALPHLLAAPTTAPSPDVQIIKEAVTMDIGGVLRGLSDMIGGVPPNFFTRERITPDRTGSGSLTRPSGSITTAANGIAWQTMERAPGLGIDEGAPDHLEVDGLELRFVLTLADGTTFTANHKRTPELDGAWLWGLVTPSRIDYWIVPGLTVRFSWLLPTLSGFFAVDPPAALPPWEPLSRLIGR